MGALVKAQHNPELPATNFLSQSLNGEVKTILSKTENKLSNVALQLSELQREYDRLEVRINNMPEYVKCRSRQKELMKNMKLLRKVQDSLGYTMNETMLQALDHIPGTTLTEKSESLRNGAK